MKLRIASALLATVSMLAWVDAPAQDGATLYKTKCAGCHGDQGQGRPSSAKLAGTSKSESSVLAVLTKGGEPRAPHMKPMTTLTPEQASAVAAYVKTLK